MAIVINELVAVRDDRMIIEMNTPVSAGGEFKIEATGHDDPMVGTVPASKIWNIHTVVTIEEEDA